ncbi:MAG: PTS transporter subunit IIB [Lachnospiraceae bacterium]|jgi:PTS system mannose-specific IIB component|nr:PTS transporter subunit IIB [Lachnospiraceae bacterium]
MYYILSSHGQYAAACKASCEMITGDAPLFRVVSFTDDMTKEAVEEAYRDILKKDGAEECGGIITDLLGGTPYNAAAPVIHDFPKLALVAGMNLGMLISLNTGDSLSEAVKAAQESVMIQEGEGKAEEVKKPAPAAPVEAAEENGIVHLRLDERLIHGQVATFWSRSLSVTRIMVIGDEIVQDAIGRGALKATVPVGVKLSILTVESACKKLNAGNYVGQRVFVVVNKPETILQMIESGVKLKEVNIGNMGKKEGRETVKKSVYCTPDEKAKILSIEKKGIPVYAQMVPNDEKKKFSEFIN